MKVCGLCCVNWNNCPLRHRPIQELEVDGSLYDCEVLVALYNKFVEIGFIKKEEKTNE